MNNLIPIEFRNQRIMTTEQLAKIYGTDSNNIQVNFSRNKDNFQEGKHYFYLEGEELKNFKSCLTNSQSPLISKFTRNLYLWTERGANRHCKILDTDKAWEQFDNLEETYFRVKEVQYPKLSKELQAIFFIDQKQQEHEEKLNKLGSKVESLALTMNITDGQAKTIQMLVHKRVKTLCQGDESNAYMNSSIRKKVYRHIWKTLKDYLNVTVYHNILRKDYSSAVEYIGKITLQGALLREVKELNSQIVFHEEVI
ncbi:ORF6C domain-containing protein [Clostridium pasteurianum]|uniref:ORF6C domain-containing protein n=1 Tax=Clostridium pasteurianum TaxID=1501 RepID=UPI0022608828|nr:ORF6C domain-containing protein [Clostridium pasteurianum]UZW13232.1 ORF6C domain-containing protein [Clostridium pasteurianum]